MSLLSTIRFITHHPLNRQHKLGSMIRFAKWQLGSRLMPGTFAFDWVNGSRFFVRNGETGLTGNIYTGLNEFSEMGFLLHYLRPEDLFVDVGANVGAYSILACSAVGARGVAFEPVPCTFRRLLDNMRLNRLEERLQCLNNGVGDQHGTLTFTSDSDTMNHALAPGEQAGDTTIVEVTSLDNALFGEEPSLIKIDVEGYETPVLLGAKDILKSRRLNAIIIELNGSGRRYGFDDSAIIDLMFSNGFGTYSYDVFRRELVDLNGTASASGNTLFIRNKTFVEERIRLAPKVDILGSQL